MGHGRAMPRRSIHRANDVDHLAGVRLMVRGGAFRAGDDLADDFTTNAAIIILRNPFPFFENESINFCPERVDTRTGFNHDSM